MDSPKREITKWSPGTPSYLQNPYPHLHDCLTNSPVQKGAFGEWVLFRYNDVKQILRSDDFLTADLSGFFESKEPVILKNTGQCPFLSKSTKKWLMYLDDDQHRSAHSLLEKVLDSFQLNAIVDSSLEVWFNSFFNQETADFSYIASVLPSLIFSELYQVESDDWRNFEKLKKVSHSLANSQDIFVSIKKYQEYNADAKWLFDTIRLDFEKRDLPDTALISRLKSCNEDMNTPFTDDELISIVIILFFAANETTVDTLTICIYEFLRNNELLDYILQADTKQINIFAEELFRFATPQQYTIRINKYPLEIDGTLIPANSRIFLCLSSANRDPAVFENPQTIVPNRSNNPHLSFGNGLHSCMGAKLARIELRSLLKPLAKILKNYRLDEESGIEWYQSIFMRGIKTLNAIHIN
ncbi:cytochrome P450 [Dyadobacter diqingensis]|uniref:cytochrome P450 n=1 Tax=Dyadobacter diqingensis TaxID=2938121 RepID=UPI0020C41B50|nr:cytochrome P450 [Dyadobacter diqingensis]